jgi:hypothetical protein
MVRRWTLITAVILCLAMPLLAQDADAAKAREKAWSFYKLSMTVREVDGAKTISSRTYDFTQRSNEWGQLRVGSRVPVVTGTTGNSMAQWQYIDVGLKVDSKVQERDNDVAFDWRLDLSSAAAESNPTGQPVIRNVSSNGQTLLAIGKPVVMTTVDDMNSTHKFVFEVTASKLK